MAFCGRSIAGFCVLAVSGLELGAQITSEDRTIAAGKLWAIIEIFHPALAVRDIDWDRAWVDAYPKLRAASNAQEYERAIRTMLDVLGDPVTAVTIKRHQSKSLGGSIVTSWDANSILTVTIPDSNDFAGIRDQLRRISDKVSQARSVIFDFRQSSLIAAPAFAASGLAERLLSKPILGPAERSRLHAGFSGGHSAALGFYYSGYRVKDGRQYLPQADAKAIPVIFVVRDRSALPFIAPALQMAGNGRIVSEGPLTDWIFVDSMPIALTDGLTVTLRLSELLYPDGTTGLSADAIVPPGNGLATAIRIASNPSTFKPVERMRMPLAASPRPDKEYEIPTHPSAAYRTLAALRIWSNYQFYYPYRDLMGEDWDQVLKHSFTAIESSEDARQYHLAVAEMISHVDDSHAVVESAILTEALGAKSPEIRVRWVENSPAVVVVNAEAQEIGITPGDVLLAIDSQDVKSRIKLISTYISASTQQALTRDVCDELLAGAEGSSVKIKLRKPSGQVYEASVTRRVDPHWYYTAGERRGGIVRLLPGNIGYVDLDRLKLPMIDDMFTNLKDSQAIIFDMRGYPSGTAFDIASRLSQRRNPIAAIIRQPILLPPRGDKFADEAVAYTQWQRIPESSQQPYTRKTVMLIDEEAQSEAEHTGLVFEAANGTKFVGSPTAGADGPVTQFSVPGGIRVSMTGMEVRHADGRQLQRLGLQPDVAVKPTIAGIASGRDEVLERAIEFIRSGK